MITKELLNELFEYRDGNLYRKRNNKKAGTVRPDGYCQIRVDSKFYLTHRLVFLMHYGYLPDLIDHIDNNPSNNKIENLRPATSQQNQFNSKLNKLNTSGIKGVYWNKQKNKWAARLRLKGRSKHVGFFSDLELADKAMIEARKEYHKEFAKWR